MKKSPDLEPDIDTAPWTENRSTEGARSLQLDELWRYRELVLFLALRDVKVRYKQAAFGVGWAVLQPLAGVAVFTVVFRLLADVPSDGVPYPAFAFLGYSVWTYFSSTLNSARASLVSNAALVTKVYFPRLAAPLATLFPGLVDLAVALVIVAGFMLFYGIVPGLPIFTLPLWIIAVTMTALGTGLFGATLNVQYRDAHHVFGLLTQLWLFASPVAYPSSLVEGGWRYLYYVNPMVAVIDGFRWSMFGAPAPGLTALVSAVTWAGLLVVGLRYFRSAERRFADVI